MMAQRKQAPSTKNFQEQMKYLKENNFQVVLLSELFKNNENAPLGLPQLTGIAIGVLAAASGSLAFRKWKRKGAKSF
jgi:hypothetical protein